MVNEIRLKFDEWNLVIHYLFSRGSPCSTIATIVGPPLLELEPIGASTSQMAVDAMRRSGFDLYLDSISIDLRRDDYWECDLALALKVTDGFWSCYYSEASPVIDRYTGGINHIDEANWRDADDILRFAKAIEDGLGPVSTVYDWRRRQFLREMALMLRSFGFVMGQWLKRGLAEPMATAYGILESDEAQTLFRKAIAFRSENRTDLTSNELIQLYLFAYRSFKTVADIDISLAKTRLDGRPNV